MLCMHVFSCEVESSLIYVPSADYFGFGDEDSLCPLTFKSGCGDKFLISVDAWIHLYMPLDFT